MKDSIKRKIRDCVKHLHHHDWLEERAKIKAQIDKLKDGNTIYVHCDSTDCDHCRVSSAELLQASVMHYVRWENYKHEYAEGYTSTSIMSRDQYIDFQPEWRDYAAEAHEDGHPHVIYR